MPTLLVHGWWNIAGAKMSKSTGNIVDPNALADKYGAEALRYYLMTDIATGRDADFSEERLVTRYNADLANSLGNLLNRTLSMTAKYRAGKLTKVISDGIVGPDKPEEIEAAIKAEGKIVMTVTSPDFSAESRNHVEHLYQPNMDRHIVNIGIEAGMRFVTLCNQAIDILQPWRVAKDPKHTKVLDSTLYDLAESLRIIAILISPVLPKAARGIFAQLNWDKDEHGNERPFRLADAVWGGLPDGHVLGQPIPLFPRIEKPAE